MPPNMIGEHDALELQIGHGHVVYTGGAKGTDELVEQMAKQFGMHPSSSHFHHPVHRGSFDASQPPSSPSGRETMETNA